MKTFYFKFTQDDFPSNLKEYVDGGSWLWRTNTYDIYNNNQFVNYATRKADYGTDLIGDGTYTGIDEYDSNTSEIGFVSGGRFIDTTSQIDIVKWSLENINKDVDITLNVRTTAYDEPATPGTWSNWTENTAAVGEEIWAINANRYVVFELDIDLDANDDPDTLEFEFYVSVDIDSAVINAYWGKTLALLNNFPEWMEMREGANRDSATPITATPSSLGGKLLNAVAGEWLTDLTAKIKYSQTQNYIQNIDLTQKAWAYRIDDVPRYLQSVRGDGVVLARCSSLNEFYETSDTDDIFYWDQRNRRIFLTHQYSTLIINSGSENENGIDWVDTQDPFHVWNSIDDIGATVDLFRLTPEEESNDSFKKRILDVYQNHPGTSLEAFKNALRRELNLWYYMDGATPDSDYVGATPTVLEMGDIEADSNYFDVEGIPTNKFKELVEYLAKNYPILWGYLRYDESFWDPDGLEHKGISSLPRQMDATPPTEADIDSGVGDGSDIYLFKPDEYTTIEEFTADLKIRGRQNVSKSEYLGLKFDIQVYGQGDIEVFDNEELTGYFTIEVTTSEPATYYCNVTVTSTSDIDLDNATPHTESQSLVDWVTPSGLTSVLYAFYNKADNELYVDDSATPSRAQIDLSTATEVKVVVGHFDYDTTSYINVINQSDYKLWFDHDPGTILGSGGAASEITYSSYDFVDGTGDIVFQSQLTSSSVVANAWTSDIQNYTVKLNGKLPDFTTKNRTINLQTINWDPNTTNREIIVNILTSDGTNYGAYAVEAAATPLFLESSYIQLDGNNTWTNGYQKTLSDSTTSFTLSTTTGAHYPLSAPDWELFEATYSNAIRGIVDINGPWRNGEEPEYESTNDILMYLSVDRSNFGIPETEDYLITWIGIDNVSNPNVICWLNTNTVRPAVTHDFEPGVNTTYPPDAVVEYYDTDLTYKLSTFPVKAKMKLSVDQHWYPKAHSGWFYDDTDEYYLYADHATVNFKPIEYVGVGTASAQVSDCYIDLDAGHQIGDLLLAFVHKNNDGNISGPEGWTEIQQDGGNAGIDNQGGVWYRYADGTEDTTAGPWTGAGNSTGICVAYRNVHTIADTSDNDDRSDTEAIYINTLPYISSKDALVIYAMEGNNSSTWTQTPPAGFTKIVDVQASSTTGRRFAVAHQLDLDYAPATPSADNWGVGMTDAVRGPILLKTKDAGGVILPNQAKQGAPVLLTDDNNTMIGRQVAFWDLDETATPAIPVLTTTNTEYIQGNGSSVLYAAYQDIYDITVTNSSLNDISVNVIDEATPSNRIVLASDTDKNYIYKITYKAVESYIVDNHSGNSATPTTTVIFDAPPWDHGHNEYVIYYEPEKYDPATPISVPLNPLYTGFGEGFIYIDHDAHDLDRIEIKVSPTTVRAVTNDYLLVAIETIDINGNPKPNVVINLYTNFGTLMDSTLTTGDDGRAYTVLDSQDWDDATPLSPSPATPALADATPNSYPQGLVLAVDSTDVAINATSAFDIHRKQYAKNRIVAVMETDSIAADGISSTYILGRVLTPNQTPVAGADVRWRKARTVYDLFNLISTSASSATPDSTNLAGTVTTDSDGRFQIGRFISSNESGYWLVVVETGTGDDLIGDITYWYEYPNITIGIDPVTNLPTYPVQAATPITSIPNYTYGSAFPVTLDEEDFLAGETPSAGMEWEPPTWYAIDKYKQYKMGLSAIEGYYSESNYGDGIDFATPPHPDYREI